MEDNNTLYVKTLGEFNVERNGADLTSEYRHSKKIWRLFQYLIVARGRPVGIDELSTLLLSDESYGEPKQQISNLVYRLRTILGEKGSEDDDKSSIVYKNNAYFWNKTEYNALDLDVIDELFEVYEQSSKSEKEIVKKGEQIIGKFEYYLLPEIDEEWVRSTRNHYMKIYKKVVSDLTYVFSLNSDYEKILDLCQEAFKLLPYNTSVHAEYMKALVQTGEVPRRQWSIIRTSLRELRKSMDLIHSRHYPRCLR